MQDFNPRLPRGKRHHILKHRGHFLFISIHASREGSDSVFKEAMELIENFNPRFPRGKRLKTDWIDQQNDLFQSTLPAGEATTWPRRNIPSLTGFQSTLPAGEATAPVLAIMTYYRLFQSTLPAGEATLRNNYTRRRSVNFNPRFPRGKRLFENLFTASFGLFQSTLPAGEATGMTSSRDLAPSFQSTLPAGEATIAHKLDKCVVSDFNPRFPRGKRHQIVSV